MNTVRLGDVVSVNPRAPALFRTKPPEEVTFLRMASVSENGHIEKSETRTYDEAKKGFTYFEEGDVLLAKITPCFENGKATIAQDLPYRVGFGSTEFHVLRPSPAIDGRYLFYLVWNTEFRKDGAKHMAGAAGQKRLPADYVADLEIPLPPLDEQKRIAAVLDKADALRRQRQESLQLTEKLLQSVFIDMFGDPVSNTKGWPTESLTKACKLSSGGTPSKSNASFWEGDLPWYTPKDLKKDELADSIDHVSADVLSQTNLKLFPAETVLIVVRGMILAHSFPVSVIKKAGVVNQDIKALTPVADLHPQFLAACLRSQRSLILTKVTTAGHGTKKLDTEGLSEIRIFLPPISLQLKFIALVNRHRELLADGVSSRDNIVSLFSSLQKRAFRGELDLSRLILGLNLDVLEPMTERYRQLIHAAMPKSLGTAQTKQAFVAPLGIELTLKTLDVVIEKGDQIAWSEDYFKYRILSQTLTSPFSFEQIWEVVLSQMEEARYETVKDKVFEYVATGLLEQQFDEKRKEIVFHPRP